MNKFSAEEIQEEINAINTCLNCVKEDGCYCCKERQPYLSVIKEMLIDYKKGYSKIRKK